MRMTWRLVLPMAGAAPRILDNPANLRRAWPAARPYLIINRGLRRQSKPTKPIVDELRAAIQKVGKETKDKMEEVARRPTSSEMGCGIAVILLLLSWPFARHF
jgi:hypothetical protein